MFWPFWNVQTHHVNFFFWQIPHSPQPTRLINLSSNLFWLAVGPIYPVVSRYQWDKVNKIPAKATRLYRPTILAASREIVHGQITWTLQASSKLKVRCHTEFDSRIIFRMLQLPLCHNLGGKRQTKNHWGYFMWFYNQTTIKWTA